VTIRRRYSTAVRRKAKYKAASEFSLQNERELELPSELLHDTLLENPLADITAELK